MGVSQTPEPELRAQDLSSNGGSSRTYLQLSHFSPTLKTILISVLPTSHEGYFTAHGAKHTGASSEFPSTVSSPGSLCWGIAGLRSL